MMVGVVVLVGTMWWGNVMVGGSLVRIKVIIVDHRELKSDG